MTEVDVQLIARWSERALDVARPEVRLLRVTDDERRALGAGFAAIRAAVLGESPEPPDAQDASVAGDLRRYLAGIAAGIEATGADRDPMSLVTGLVTGAAHLQFSRGRSADGTPTAAEAATRAGMAAADLATDGAALDAVVDAVVEVLDGGVPGSAGGEPTRVGDRRLHALLVLVLDALRQVVVPDDGSGRGRAGCGAGADEHAGRRFLAEVTFRFAANPGTRQRLSDALDQLGTDLRSWPGPDADDTASYHLHTVHPGAVVEEIYAIGTPFDLRIGTLEPRPAIPDDLDIDHREVR